MGAYVSLEVCRDRYHVNINCNVTYTNNSNTTLAALGDIKKGEYGGDPDIAGIGIFASFVAVTALALVLSFIIVVLRMIKHRIVPFCFWKKGHSIADSVKIGSLRPSISEILQAMVLSCSDSQLFTGAAYAITLRFFTQCGISAYHYNMVSNMMLLTCATHLMAIVVVRDYWKYPYLAVLRAICKTGIFLITGLLLANQNADLKDAFPTELPKPGTHNSLMLLGAACFQTNSPQLQRALDKSFHDFKGSIINSSPGNRIEGWNKYIVILLWYCVALLVEIAMFIRRGKMRNGRRANVVVNFWKLMMKLVSVFSRKPLQSPQSVPYHRPRVPTLERKSAEEKTICYVKRAGQYILAFYSLTGIAICVWTVVESGMYMAKLRLWVQKSGWMAVDDNGKSAEDEPTSFGQLVPMLTSGLVILTFLEMWSAAMSSRKDAKHTRDLERRLDLEHNQTHPGSPEIYSPNGITPMTATRLNDADLWPLSSEPKATHHHPDQIYHQNPLTSPRPMMESDDAESGVLPRTMEQSSVRTLATTHGTPDPYESSRQEMRRFSNDRDQEIEEPLSRSLTISNALDSMLEQAKGQLEGKKGGRDNSPK